MLFNICLFYINLHVIYIKYMLYKYYLYLNDTLLLPPDYIVNNYLHLHM